MPSARDIIKSAMQDLGVLAASREPSADDLNDAFTRLNRMISGWANQQATIFTTLRKQFPLTANRQSYTIGPGADFDTFRPLVIEGIAFIQDTTAALPIETDTVKPWTSKDYRLRVVKGVTSSVASGAYYDFAFNGPLGWGNISIYPIPTTAVTAIVLYLPNPMMEFADLGTIYAFPPGYEEAIVANLAIRLAPMFQTKAGDEVREIARDSMSWLKRANNRPRELGMDPSLCGYGRPYNIWTDQ